MRKFLVLLAGTVFVLAGCNAKTEPDATPSEAGADDAVNLATDVAPDVTATTVPLASESPDPIAAPSAPAPEAKNGGTATVQP